MRLPWGMQTAPQPHQKRKSTCPKILHLACGHLLLRVPREASPCQSQCAKKKPTSTPKKSDSSHREEECSSCHKHCSEEKSGEKSSVDKHSPKKSHKKSSKKSSKEKHHEKEKPGKEKQCDRNKTGKDKSSKSGKK